MLPQHFCGLDITTGVGINDYQFFTEAQQRASRIVEGPGLKVQKLDPEGNLMRQIRGGEISMIFQDPMTSLNPVYSVGFQIVENIKQHIRVTRKAARRNAVAMLERMSIPLAGQRYDEYPHQFSGGMRQRAMISMALACNPNLLIADEPTTALDVTVQAQILELMKEIQVKFNTSIMLITHNMGVIAEMTDDVAVMYMGKIVETTDVDTIFDNPLHPYTQKLLQSIPMLGLGHNQDLQPITGSTPEPYDLPEGCSFRPRCDRAMEVCRKDPPLVEEEDGHHVRCWLYEGETGVASDE